MTEDACSLSYHFDGVPQTGEVKSHARSSLLAPRTRGSPDRPTFRSEILGSCMACVGIDVARGFAKILGTFSSEYVMR